MARTPIPPATETEVLKSSARRCAFCFGLNGDLSVKSGQIAHVDQDSSNAAEGNLVFLCLLHHDEYDSRTSQRKNLTSNELRVYKAQLIEAIAQGRHVEAANARSPAQRNDEAVRAHDTRIFLESDDVLPERDLRLTLEGLTNAHQIRSSRFASIHGYLDFFVDAGHEFLLPELTETHEKLFQAVDQLLEFISLKFFDYPASQPDDDRRSCLFPELNVDRGGDGSKEQIVRYSDYASELEKKVASVGRSYVEFRRTVKRSLQV